MIHLIDEKEIEKRLAEPGGFETLGLSDPILQALDEMGFVEPMPVQKVCIPAIIEGDDVIGQARTGTGKTVAFGVPIVQEITTAPYVQSLILTPTRELCLQVAGEIDRVCAHTGHRVVPVYGGQPIERQLKALQRGAQIVVGTPGRLIDHIKRRTLFLDDVEIVVLDEADEMFDMGFIDDIRYILARTPNDRQTCLFSATFPEEILRLVDDFMYEPHQYNLSSDQLTVDSTNQIFYEVPDNDKLEALCSIIDHEEPNLALVFCRTRWETQQLGTQLKGRGYVTMALHGDMSQSERERAMKSFRSKKIEILVATDVAARGIDVSDVTHVINYHIPQNSQGYVHRIGRTGRAGKLGTAITLVSPKEYYDLYRVQAGANVEIEVRPLPDGREVDEKRRIRFLRTLLEGTAAKEAQERFGATVKELGKDFDLETLASVLLQHALERTGLEKPHYRGRRDPEADARAERDGAERGPHRRGRESRRDGGKDSARRERGPRKRDEGGRRSERKPKEAVKKVEKKAEKKDATADHTRVPHRRRLR